MSETKKGWTPGPWFMRSSSTGISIFAMTPTREIDSGVFGTRARRERPVATTANAHSRPDEQCNATLISVAPTMAAYIEKKAGEGDAEAAAILAEARGEELVP